MTGYTIAPARLALNCGNAIGAGLSITTNYLTEICISQAGILQKRSEGVSTEIDKLPGRRGDIVQSLKPQKPFISRRPITKTLTAPKLKLYAIIITDGAHFVTYLVQRKARLLAESAAKKLIKGRPHYSVYGVNLVDSNILDTGGIVHIF